MQNAFDAGKIQAAIFGVGVIAVDRDCEDGEGTGGRYACGAAVQCR